MKNIFKTSFSKKKVVLIFIARLPLPLKTIVSYHKWFCVKKGYVNFLGKMRPFPKKWSNVHLKQFFTVFSENAAFFEKIVESKNIQHLIRDKKGYIHFC